MKLVMRVPLGFFEMNSVYSLILSIQCKTSQHFESYVSTKTETAKGFKKKKNLVFVLFYV